MGKNDSLPGEKSRVFAGLVGQTVAAADFSPGDYLIDRKRFKSEGMWAFCRFENEAMPGARMGFQVGGFNVGAKEEAIDRNFLQLHLELMTREGAVLWLASGRYSADQVETDSAGMDVRFAVGGEEVFSWRGWPKIECHFRSEDGDAEAWLTLDLKSVTVLPDCVLPQTVFAMWESLGDVRGRVRYLGTTTEVSGKVFFDHPRVREGANAVAPRKMYVYTTLYFAEGGGIYGYHAVDDTGKVIDYYCFGIYVDAAGKGRFLGTAQTVGLQMDSDNIPERWGVRWKGEGVSVAVDITVKHDEIVRSWGSEKVPKARKDYIIMALVLNGAGTVTEDGKERAVTGKGLAEFFDVGLWTG